MKKSLLYADRRAKLDGICKRKVTYKNKQSAIQAKKKALKLYNAVLYMYKCDKCRLYHLTKRIPAVKEREITLTF